MASKRRNWNLRQARKNQLVPAIGKNGGFPAYWMHDKQGNRSALDNARGRKPDYQAVYDAFGIVGFIQEWK